MPIFNASTFAEVIKNKIPCTPEDFMAPWACEASQLEESVRDLASRMCHDLREHGGVDFDIQATSVELENSYLYGPTHEDQNLDHLSIEFTVHGQSAVGRMGKKLIVTWGEDSPERFRVIQEVADTSSSTTCNFHELGTITPKASNLIQSMLEISLNRATREDNKDIIINPFTTTRTQIEPLKRFTFSHRTKPYL